MAIKKTKKKGARAAKPAVAECACGADCKCCGCGCRCWKKIGTFVLGVIVGAAVCCAICKKPCLKRFGGAALEPAFTAEGCLDIAKIKEPGKLEMIKARFGDKPCITKADMFGGDRPAPRPRRQRPQPAI